MLFSDKSRLDTLQCNFDQLLSGYTIDQEKKEYLAKELYTAYSAHYRHYHTLEHIHHVLLMLATVDCYDEHSLWAAWYHDIIYIPGRKDNERKSAEYAQLRLADISMQETARNRIFQMIIATKTHQVTDDHQCNLFLDADMSILGSEHSTYQTYVAQVVAEYRLIPQPIFAQLRKKFVRKLLKQPSIFWTDEFKTLFENSAQENLHWELDTCLLS